MQETSSVFYWGQLQESEEDLVTLSQKTQSNLYFSVHKKIGGKKSQLLFLVLYVLLVFLGMHRWVPALLQTCASQDWTRASAAQAEEVQTLLSCSALLSLIMFFDSGITNHITAHIYVNKIEKISGKSYFEALELTFWALYKRSQRRVDSSGIRCYLLYWMWPKSQQIVTFFIGLQTYRENECWKISPFSFDILRSVGDLSIKHYFFLVSTVQPSSVINPPVFLLKFFQICLLFTGIENLGCQQQKIRHVLSTTLLKCVVF